MPHVEEEFLDWLRGLSCEDLHLEGIPDGTVVYAAEPLIKLMGPFALIQILETPILNLINFSSLLCTNATRMVMVAGEDVKCVEFGARRA